MRPGVTAPRIRRARRFPIITPGRLAPSPVRKVFSVRGGLRARHRAATEPRDGNPPRGPEGTHRASTRALRAVAGVPAATHAVALSLAWSPPPSYRDRIGCGSVHLAVPGHPDGTRSSHFFSRRARPSSHTRPPSLVSHTPTFLARAVTTATTLDKGLGILESAAPDASAAFDVALVEGKQAEPLFHAAPPSAPAPAVTTTVATVTVPDVALSARFTRLAKDVAIVLMHEEEDVSSKAYMIEAIKVGVVDVVRFPLVKQSMRTLWQHAVRKMIRAQAEASAKRSGGPVKRVSSRVGLGLDQDNSGDSSASEERALKRQTAGSPASVLDEEEKAGVAESGCATKRGAAGSKGGAGAKGSGKESAATEGSGKKSGGAAKPKPQVRSTQQWKAAEQRGRRLAIKPHTAMTQGAQAGAPGAQMGRMGYYHPQQGQMMGQTQTMTINGQQVQVWLPMQHGMYAHPQQQNNNSPAQGAAPQNGGAPQNTAQLPTNGPNGASSSGGKTGAAGGGSGAQQQQPQQQHGYYGGGGMMQMQGVPSAAARDDARAAAKRSADVGAASANARGLGTAAVGRDERGRRRRRRRRVRRRVPRRVPRRRSRIRRRRRHQGPTPPPRTQPQALQLAAEHGGVERVARRQVRCSDGRQ